MPSFVKCKQCGKVLKVPPSIADKRLRCRKCKSLLEAPERSPKTDVEEPSPRTEDTENTRAKGTFFYRLRMAVCLAAIFVLANCAYLGYQEYYHRGDRAKVSEMRAQLLELDKTIRDEDLNLIMAKEMSKRMGTVAEYEIRVQTQKERKQARDDLKRECDKLDEASSERRLLKPGWMR